MSFRLPNKEVNEFMSSSSNIVEKKLKKIFFSSSRRRRLGRCGVIGVMKTCDILIFAESSLTPNKSTAGYGRDNKECRYMFKFAQRKRQCLVIVMLSKSKLHLAAFCRCKNAANARRRRWRRRSQYPAFVCRAWMSAAPRLAAHHTSSQVAGLKRRRSMRTCARRTQT